MTIDDGHPYRDPVDPHERIKMVQSFLTQYSFRSPIAMQFGAILDARPDWRTVFQLQINVKTWDSNVSSHQPIVEGRLMRREPEKTIVVAQTIDVFWDHVFQGGYLNHQMLHRKVEDLAKDVWDHEFTEWFRVNGQPVRDPHPERISGYMGQLIIDDPL